MQRQLGDSQIKQEKKSLEIFYENVAKGLLASPVRKFSSSQTNRPAERIPVKHATLVGKSQCSHHISAERSKHQNQKNCEEMHYNVLHKIRCWILYKAVF
jgi:hypothetical protein